MSGILIEVLPAILFSLLFLENLCGHLGIGLFMRENQGSGFASELIVACDCSLKGQPQGLAAPVCTTNGLVPSVEPGPKDQMERESFESGTSVVLMVRHPACKA